MQVSWLVNIGLEVHAQIVSKAKLFSRGATGFTLEPNTNVDYFDIALPGALPVLNLYPVHQAVKACVALDADIQELSRFDRKNYMYPDLSSGYQISQFYKPIAWGGHVMISVPLGDGNYREKTIRLSRIHLEQDAGKLVHDLYPGKTLIDYNRAGMPLIEIVTQPDINSAQEASAYVKALRSLLRQIGVCDGNMQEGSLRVDVNVSVRKDGNEELGTRCEIKNVNSFKFIRQAVDYEVQRQIQLLESGEKVEQQTRLFDASKGQTYLMRSKEDVLDYRYYPDPDLPVLRVSKEMIKRLRKELPELPYQKARRFHQQYGLSEDEVNLLSSDHNWAEYFEDVVRLGADPKATSSWIITELFALLKKLDVSLHELVKLLPTNELAYLQKQVELRSISRNQAKVVINSMLKEQAPRRAKEIIEQMCLKQMTDPKQLQKLLEHVLEETPEAAQKLHDGCAKTESWIIGKIMKTSGETADVQLVKELIRKFIDDSL